MAEKTRTQRLQQTAEQDNTELPFRFWKGVPFSEEPRHANPNANPKAQTGPLGPGVQLGQYELIRELGSGGMGVVYLARDSKLGRKVAIKVLGVRDPEFTKRFVAEARVTARCTHENIVVIHEVGEHQGEPYMVLEYLEGQPLAALRGTTQPITRVVEIIVGVVRALTRAHEQGIVHRDLKPENIFLTSSGGVKVLDFGIAKLVHGEIDRMPPSSALVGRELNLDSNQSATVGTLYYMSPEQWGVNGPIDHRTDIWAVGLLLYELLAGRHPLEAVVRVDQWCQDLNQSLPELHSVVPRVPAELAAIVTACVSKVKERRIPDASALLRALEPFLPGHLAAGPLQLELGPYAGLRAFQEEDAGRFFGRDQEVAALASRLTERPFLAVVGPSGIGKSSLVRAGVVPSLKASGENWNVVITRPGRDPLAALARLLIPMLTSGMGAQEEQLFQDELRSKLSKEPGYFGTALRVEARKFGAELMVLIDQFEELYTLETDLAARRAFCACLLGAADDAASPLRVVVTLRADFLGRVAEDPTLMDEVSKGLFFLGPPTPEGLRQALLRPAELVGYRFESDGPVNEMVRYLESAPAGLPLLQFAAAQLWDTRDASRKVLTDAAYYGLGGVGGALVTHAEKVLGKLSPSLKSLCRSLLVHLVTPERTRAVRRVDELRELLVTGDAQSEDMNRLLHHLAESRLIVTHATDGFASAELVHESLVNNWPTLRRWLDESQEEGVFLDQLLAAARQWHSNRRDPGLLWHGEMAQELRRFERRFKGNLPQAARDFAREISRVTRGAIRRKRALQASGIAVLVVLLAAASVALFVIRKSQLRAEEAAGQARAAQAEAQSRFEALEVAQARERALNDEKALINRELHSANTDLEAQKQELLERERDLKDAALRLRSALGNAEAERVTALAAKSRAEQEQQRAEEAVKVKTELIQEKELRLSKISAQLGAVVQVLR